jgi:hypothetical protein
MAPKGPLKDSWEPLIGRNCTLFGTTEGRAFRSSMIFKGPAGKSSLALFGSSHDRIDALAHSKVSQHSWKPEGS